MVMASQFKCFTNDNDFSILNDHLHQIKTNTKKAMNKFLYSTILLRDQRSQCRKCQNNNIAPFNEKDVRKLGMFSLVRLFIYFVFFVFPFFFFVFGPATSVTSNLQFSVFSIKNFLFAYEVDVFLKNLPKHS